MIPDHDAVNILFLGPHRKPGHFIGTAQKGHVAANGNGTAKKLNVPGFNNKGVGA